MLGAGPICAADPAGVSADDEAGAAAFTEAIDRLVALDPQMPALIETRLRFADFLAKAAGGDCALRLDNAQRQLQSVRANEALAAVLPAGLARAASIEYQIHVARAGCAGDALARERELRAALESAQHAVGLYRDAFDAVSMVTMQFNAGVTYHTLGDDGGARAALQMAIDLDRDYGFRADAEDNYRLILQWSNAEAGPEQIAALMSDFPRRSATLKFAWYGSDADLSLESDYTRIVGAEVSHSRAERSVRRHVRERANRFVVSYESRSTDYDIGAAPSGETAFVQGFTIPLTRMLLHFHDFDVARNGDFDASTGAGKFNARVRAESSALAHDVGSKSEPALKLQSRIEEAVKFALLPRSIETQVAEDYNLETGTWIGATLEQGIWYDMAAPLPLPLLPQILVAHKIEFAYTRSLPCTAASPERSCIEIVLHAAPDPAALAAILDLLARSFHLPRGQLLRCSSATEMRLVTDPATLQPYVRDTRHYSYWSKSSNDSLILGEKTLSVSGRPLTPGNPAEP
jgi:tetratricopeptide (TPR) repeat protein